MVTRQPVPLTVVGGFLGTGKTTLVNHVLAGDHGLRIAVIVNDFGAVNIDAALVTATEGGMFSLANGCVCCGLNAGLVEQLEALLGHGGRFDHVLVEASGVADPGRVMDTVRHARFRGRLRPDAVVVLVDAAGFEAARAAAPGLVETQLDAADLVVLNKTDLATRAGIDAWRARWAAPDSRIVETVDARVPFEILFAGELLPRPGHAGDGAHRHAHAQAASAAWRAAGPVDLAALQSVLSGLPPSIYRAKGIVQDAEGRAFAVHLVGRRLTFTPLPGLPAGFEPAGAMVFIGFGDPPDHSRILGELDRCASSGDRRAEPGPAPRPGVDPG